MRLAKLILAAAAVAAPGVPGAAAAQRALVATPPMAAGEVLLEVDAVGTSVAAADRARIQLSFTSRAATPQASRAAVEALVRQATDAARAAGVAPADILPPRASGPALGFVGNEAPEAYELAAQAAQIGERVHVATRRLDILVRDPARAEHVRDALERGGVENVSGPIYELSDDRAARREARVGAIADARSRAEDFAAAAGLRVGRIVRISERLPSDFGGWAVLAAMVERSPQSRSGTMSVETQAHVSVDFALAPQ